MTPTSLQPAGTDVTRVRWSIRARTERPGLLASTVLLPRADYFFFLDVRPVGLLAFARSLAAALFCALVEDLVASFLAAFFASFLDVSPPGLAACARSLAAALFCALVEDFVPSFFPAFFASFLVVLSFAVCWPVAAGVRAGGWGLRRG